MYDTACTSVEMGYLSSTTDVDVRRPSLRPKLHPKFLELTRHSLPRGDLMDRRLTEERQCLVHALAGVSRRKTFSTGAHDE